jgi:hypothetical protein
MKRYAHTWLAAAVLLLSLPICRGVPFPDSAGNYGGFAQTDDNDPLSAALVSIDLTVTGSFTGSVVFRSNKTPITGNFAADTGQFEKIFRIAGVPGVDLFVRAQLDTANRVITGTVEQQSNGSSFLTALFTLSGAGPDPVLGAALAGTRRTAFIDPPNAQQNIVAAGATVSQEIPGDGFSVVTVGKTKQRAARFVGQLPDAAKYSSGSRMRGANYTVFSGLYKRKVHGRSLTGGQTLGLAEVTGAGGETPELSSRLSWGKGAGVEDNYYNSGFEAALFINQAVLYPKTRNGALPPIGLKPGLEHNATLKMRRGNLVQDFEAKLSISPQAVKVLETSGVPAGSGANPYRLKVRMNVFMGDVLRKLRAPRLRRVDEVCRCIAGGGRAGGRRRAWQLSRKHRF